MTDRKLAVILHADIIGSTELVRVNETIAHDRIRAAFTAFSEIIESYNGKTREIRGDALVAEFSRVSDATCAALSFQSSNETTNRALTNDIRPQLRIGIAMAEMVIADNTVTGEGVVLAQRLEQLSEPGGIVIQAAASETIPGRFPFEFGDLGEQVLKGFEQPTRAYTVKLRNGQSVPEPQSEIEKKRVNTKPFIAESKLVIPDKPSIAVMPFANMSGDPDQDYFSNGITEDIITNLSRFRDRFVIASNSTFAYKGKSIKIQDVSRELGVQFILEGSVQKSENRVRISAQLIDGLTGRHLWAERYQREIKGIFELQDEVVETIVGTLATGYGGRLRKAWQRQTDSKESGNFQAFDCFMRGMDVFDNFTREDTILGRKLFEQAIKFDPRYGKAYAKLAWTYILDAIEGWQPDYEDLLAKGLKVATMGVKQDSDESWTHWALGSCYFFSSQFELAFSEFDLAMDLNPNDADVMADIGFFKSYAGNSLQGLEYARKAMRLNPHYPQYYLAQYGQICFDARRYEEAITSFERVRELDTTRMRLYQAASFAALKDIELAKKSIHSAFKHDPDAKISKWCNLKMAPYKNETDRQHLADNLRVAGLPE